MSRNLRTPKLSRNHLITCWAMKMKNKIIFIFVSLLIFSCAEAEQFNTIVGECWEGRGHPEMSKCVAERADTTRANLETEEKSFRALIEKSQEESSYSKAVSSAFEVSVESFRKYRNEQCSLIFFLASAGNGAEDNKMACEAQLNIERIEQLNAAKWWVKQ